MPCHMPAAGAGGRTSPNCAGNDGNLHACQVAAELDPTRRPGPWVYSIPYVKYACMHACITHGPSILYLPISQLYEVGISKMENAGSKVSKGTEPNTPTRFKPGAREVPVHLPLLLANGSGCDTGLAWSLVILMSNYISQGSHLLMFEVKLWIWFIV